MTGAFSLIAAMALVSGMLPPADDLPVTVRFNRDIRPLLSDNCFFCHGPDAAQRKSDLRLDTKEGLLGKPGESGTVVPGKPEMSDLLARLRETDATKKMPPPKSAKKLSDREIRLIEKWVAQGANFEGHWSFEPVRVTEEKAAAPGANEIDWFIGKKLLATGVGAVPQADKRTLLRRLSFDLTGLPPTPGEMDAFLADNSPGAYERQVERLLASPRHAERLAMWWLDLVRYADSVGYHGDQPVSVHPGVCIEYAVRPLHNRTTGGRPAAQPNPGADDCLGLQPFGHDERRGRRATQGIPGQIYCRACAECQWCVAWGDAWMRGMPRPQI